MPIIAQQLINININDNLEITILGEIDSCGCIQAELLSTKLNTSLLQLKNTLAHIASTNQISCDDNFNVCCGDKSVLEKFIAKLKSLED